MAAGGAGFFIRMVVVVGVGRVGLVNLESLGDGVILKCCGEGGQLGETKYVETEFR